MGSRRTEQHITSTSSRPATPRGYLRMASPLLRKSRTPLLSADVERYRLEMAINLSGEN